MPKTTMSGTTIPETQTSDTVASVKRRQRWHLWAIRGVPYYFDSRRHQGALRWGWSDYVYSGQSVLAHTQPRITAGVEASKICSSISPSDCQKSLTQTGVL